MQSTPPNHPHAEMAISNSLGSWSRRVESNRSFAYNVEFVPSIETLADRLVNLLGTRASLWVTTPTVHRLYAKQLQTMWRALGAANGSPSQSDLQVLECSEANKTLAEVTRVCEWAQARDLERSSVFVSIGGGVVSDIVTMAASMFRRGVQHIRVPTTLLGLIDAGIGAKGAVNHGGRKNSLGCFYPPASALLCPRFTATLPSRQLRSGMAEILKVAMAGDSDLFALLETEGSMYLAAKGQGSPTTAERILRASVDRMLDELEPNLFEDQTYARRMDFGHTLSPALEAACGYALLHGEAVAIDMAFTTALGHSLGWLGRPDATRIFALMNTLGLPTYDARLDAPLARHALREAVRHRGGELLMFVPDGIGSVRCLRELDALSDSILQRTFRHWGQLAQ